MRAIPSAQTVILGALDPLTTVAVARRAADVLGAELVVMDGAAYGPMLGPADAFARVL